MIPLSGAVDYISNRLSKALLLLSCTIDHDCANLSRCSESARAMSAPCGLSCVIIYRWLYYSWGLHWFLRAFSTSGYEKGNSLCEKLAELDLVFKSRNEELVWQKRAHSESRMCATWGALLPLAHQSAFSITEQQHRCSA